MNDMRILGGLPLAPRIGAIRGMEVRLHLATVALLLISLIQGVASHGLAGALHTLILAAALLGVILWHELGHAFMARAVGLRVDGILLWPLGGECQLSGGMPSPRAEMRVAAAGPAAHAVLVILTFLPIYLFAPRLVHVPVIGPGASAVWSAWSLAFYILVFNLIPAFPLDGGRFLRALLAPRLGDVRATLAAARIGQGFWALAIVAGLAGYGGGLLMFLGFYLAYQAEMELRAARYAGYVYDPGAAGFLAGSGGWREAWSAPGAYGRREPERAGFFRRLALRWRMRRLERETRRREQLQAEVDRLLEKVGREGLPSLTRNERRTLERASRDYRDRR